MPTQFCDRGHDMAHHSSDSNFRKGIEVTASKTTQIRPLLCNGNAFLLVNGGTDLPIVPLTQCKRLCASDSICEVNNRGSSSPAENKKLLRNWQRSSIAIDLNQFK